MNVVVVMDELGQALDTIEGLRVYPYWEENPAPPAAIVEWPNPLTFHTTMRRGSDTIIFPISVIVGRVDTRSATENMGIYIDESGSSSVRAALENYQYTTTGRPMVQSVEFGVSVIAGVQMLVGKFQVRVVGSGS